MLEVKAQSGTVVGYASCWLGPMDSKGDVVAPGAFRDALEGGTLPPTMLVEHRGAPVGQWTAAVEDDIGLKVTGTVSDPSTLADVRSGKLDGLSLGFGKLTTKSHTADGTRVLDQVDLKEISLVKRPASSRTRVLSVKSADAGKEDHMTIEDTGPAVEVETETKSIGDTVAEAVTAAMAPVNDRLSKLETIGRRHGAVIETKSADDRKNVEQKAFNTFVRRGREALEPLEIKSVLRVSDDTSGGFLAPDQFVAELLRNVVRFSPIRALARVSTTGASNVILPKRTGTLTGYWVDEIGTRTGTSPEYGQAQLPVRTISCYVDLSNQLLDDAAFDIASELAFDFAEEFGKLEGESFVSGNSAGRPQGYMSNLDLLYTNSGDASTIKADGLIQLYHDLAPAYRANATLVMNSSTLAVIRKLKDGTTNQYLLTTAGQFGGAPMDMLFGRPVVEAVDMPDISGSAYPVVFGDFNAGYRIYDRLALGVLRYPFSVATSGCTRFHATRRLAAGVVKAEALRKLKIAS